jgi:hypothetical protein
MSENQDHIELFKVIEERLTSALGFMDDGRIWLAREEIETVLEDVFGMKLSKD